MSAVRPLRVNVPLQSSALKTSPLEIVRWASMADCGTPFSRRRALSLDGVRATDGESANSLAKRKAGKVTSSAVISSFESRDEGCKGTATCCAVKDNKRLAVCHCGFW